MAILNDNYNKLVSRYLFGEIGNRTKNYIQINPNHKLIKMGIGDTTQALPVEIIDSMHIAVDKLGDNSTYTGYADRGASSDIALRQEICKYYQNLGVKFDISEIIISDGAKGDSASIHQIFPNSTIAVQDPAYPVYVDSSVLYGQTGIVNELGEYKNMVYMRSNAENGFVCQPPNTKVDIIYLCFPNNPTGAVATREQLQSFVDYAILNQAIIVFDAAYSWFITDPALPKSIYEIEGAKKCAIELNSFSKFAGFTGLRLGWSVAPLDLQCQNSEYAQINKTWTRRSDTHFNGASIVSQMAGITALQNMDKCQSVIDYYLNNAKLIKNELQNLGLVCFGGDNAPYIWVEAKLPNDQVVTSWEYFDFLLNSAEIICIPGSGFGPSGENFVRFSAFGNVENTLVAMKRIADLYA